MHDPLENIKQHSRFPLLLLLFQSLRQQIRWKLLGNLIVTFCASDRDGYGLQMFMGPYGICILSSEIIMKYTVLEGKDNLIINTNQCSCSLNDCKSVIMEFQTFPVFIHCCIFFPYYFTSQIPVFQITLWERHSWSENKLFFPDTSKLIGIVHVKYNSYWEISTSGFPSENLLSCFSPNTSNHTRRAENSLFLSDLQQHWGINENSHN